MINKYQGSLNILYGGRCCPKDGNFEEAKDVLQELVDKGTPTKPVVLKEVIIAITIEGEKTISRIYGCPKCKHIVNFPHKHCDECGQKLDWSDK